MGVQVALDVGKRDQLRQEALEGGLDLAVVLAQLGLDVRQSDLCVGFLLGAAGDLGVILEDAVLVHLQAALHAPAAHRDVVRLGPGEIVQRRAVARLGHHADVHLQSGAQAHRRAGVPVAEHVIDVFESDEPAHDVRVSCGGDQDVEVAHGLLAPPVAAGHHDLADACRLAKMLDQILRDAFHRRQQQPRLCLHAMRECVEEPLFHLRAEAAQVMDPARLRRGGEIIGTLDPELVIERLDPLGPERSQAQNLEQAFWHPPLGLFQQGEMAGAHDLPDLAGEVLADAVQLREVFAGRHQCRDLVREVADDARCVAVGAHPERVRTLDLEQIGEAVEDPRHVGVVYGHATACLARDSCNRAQA